MDPITAALIIAAISTGATMYMNNQASKAQEQATKEANEASKFSQETEAKRTQQIANNAASQNKRRNVQVLRKPTNAAAGPAGSTQVAGTGGLTQSSGGVNPNAGTAGTF